MTQFFLSYVRNLLHVFVICAEVPEVPRHTVRIRDLVRLIMKKSMQMLVALVAMSMVLWVAVDSTSEADALSNGVAFGAFVKPVNGQTNITAIQNLERQLGAELPVIRAFSNCCLLYTSPSPRDRTRSRMPSSA